MNSRLAVSTLSMYLRRFPWESGRWRFIPFALHQCRRAYTTSTDRVVRTRHGFRMQVDVADWLGRHVYVTGEYEPSTTCVVKALLQPGGTFLDIGANIGYFTLLAAKCVGPSGKVLSFEPVPYVRERLISNVKLNRYRHCNVRSEAISNEAGEVQFYQGPADHVGISSLRKLDGECQILRVQTQKLDDVLPDDLHVSMMKIDIEGAEFQALEGMQGCLGRCHPDLIIEVTRDYLQGMDHAPEDLLKILEPFGYRMFAIGHDSLIPVEEWSKLPSQFNALFTTRTTLPPQLSVAG